MSLGGEQIAALYIALGADITDFEKKMKRAQTRIQKTGEGFIHTGAAMTKAITVPIALIGGLSVRAATKYESAFAGVRKTVDATEEQFQRLRRGILDMNTELPASAEEIAHVAESAGQLGIAQGDILSFTRTMIDLGETTDISANDAAVALAQLANILGTLPKNFRRMGDAIVDLGNNSATFESKIIQMSLRLAGAAKQINLTEAEVFGFSATLSQLGIEADAGGTALSKVFIQISKAVATGSKDLSTFAHVAGMSTDEFSQKFKQDAAGAIIDFVEGLGRVKDSGGNLFVVLDSLGIQERRVTNALLAASAAGDVLRSSIDRSSKAWDENRALTEEAEKRYATTESQLRMAAGQGYNTAVAIGDNLKGALVAVLVPLKGFLASVERAAINFQKLPIGVKAVVGGLLALLAAAGPTLVLLGSLAKAFVAVKEAALIMGITVKGALISSGIGALLVALALEASFIVDHWKEVGPFFRWVWAQVVLHTAQGVDTFLASIDGMVAWIPGATAAIAAARGKLSDVIDEAKIKSQTASAEEAAILRSRAAEKAATAAKQAAIEEALAAATVTDAGGDLTDSAKAVLDIYDQLAKDTGFLSEKQRVLGTSFNAASEEVGLLEAALTNLIEAGADPSSEAFVRLKDRLHDARIEAKGAIKAISDLAELQSQPSPVVQPTGLTKHPTTGPEAPTEVRPVAFNPNDLIPTPVGEPKLIAWFQRTLSEAQDWAGQIAQAIGDGMREAAATFLEGLGRMAAGQASAKDVFNSVLGILGDMAIRVGKIAIGTGAAIDGIKKALESLNPVIAIAAGAALIALGGWVKGSLAKASSPGGSAGTAAVTTLGNFASPYVPPFHHASYGRTPTEAPSRSSAPASTAGSGDMAAKRTVQIVPEVLPSGDLEFSLRESRRRARRYGTEVI